MKHLAFLFFFIIVYINAQSQSRKDLREAGIRSRIETVEENKKGIRLSYTESIEYYDENGNLIEVKEWDEKGDTRRHETFQYSEGNKLIRKAEINAVTEKEKNIILYTYDNKDRLIKEEYQNAKGVKDEIIEFEYDGKFKTKKTKIKKGNVVEIKYYQYNK